MQRKPFAKHFRLLVLAAMVVALLAVAPAAQAAAPATTLSKSASPNPATKGQSLTFSISETNNTQAPVTVTAKDILATNLTFTGFGNFFGNTTGVSGCFVSSITPPTQVTCSFTLDPGTFEGIDFSVTPTTAGSTSNTVADDQGNSSSVLVCIKDSNGVGCTSPPPPPHHKKHHRHHH